MARRKTSLPRRSSRRPSSAMSSSLPLDVQEFSCFYGKKCAVDRASVAVRENEVVALIGANGAGKSSLLRGIIGLNPAVTGTVRVFGNKQHRAEPSKLARLGVALMPQENGVFGQLSLADNLATARFSAADGDRKSTRLNSSHLGIPYAV